MIQTVTDKPADARAVTITADWANNITITVNGVPLPLDQLGVSSAALVLAPGRSPELRLSLVPDSIHVDAEARVMWERMTSAEPIGPVGSMDPATDSTTEPAVDTPTLAVELSNVVKVNARQLARQWFQLPGPTQYRIVLDVFGADGKDELFAIDTRKRDLAVFQAAAELGKIETLRDAVTAALNARNQSHEEHSV